MISPSLLHLPIRGWLCKQDVIIETKFYLIVIFKIKFSIKNKFQRTVTFTKGSDSLEKVKIRPVVESSSTSHFVGKPSSNGRRYQNHTGGCNRQQDVKLELQMNKVCADKLPDYFHMFT